MESLALLVSLLLLLLFIGGPVALALSFVRNRITRIVAICLAVPAIVIGIQLIASAAGNTNAVLIGTGGLAMAVGAIVNSVRNLRN